MSSNIMDEDIEILIDFINESNDAVSSSESILLKLEDAITKNDEIDPSNIDKIFRTFHSIKGSAGFIGLTKINSVTHHAETLLDLIRKKKTELVKEHIDIFLEVCDTLQMMMDHLQSEHTEEGAPGEVDDLKNRLDGMVKKAEGGEAPKPREEKKVEKEKKTSEILDQEALITPEMAQQFIVDSRELIDNVEQDLLALEQQPDNLETTESAFRSLHSLKGNAGFFNYTDIIQVCHKAETFLDMVRTGSIKAESKQISIILKVLDFIRAAIDLLEQGQSPIIAGRIGLIDLMDEVFNLEAEGAEPEELELPEEQEKPEVAKEEPAPVETKPAEPEKKEPAPQAAEAVKPEKKKPAPETKKPRAAVKDKKAAESKKSSSEVIRVDVDKLNKLMDLVGEIVIAEAMVSQNPAIEYEKLEGLERSVAYLQKNVRELQELATSMRMIPLSGVFGKMRRLVRDISSRSKKTVDLSVFGGDTEVDRSVIEHISDPLVHILRNSVDHGIEMPEIRTQGGKTETGSVVLEAKQVGGEIWIIIQDDGAGLNRERILKKAIEKGLLTDSDSEIADEKVWNLIFQAGFSTASKVTDISGRGVGMDVVNRNLEKIRGRVDIKSVSGQGTTMTLKIPLTTAIVDGMLMRVENALYAIPTLDIKESLQVKGEDVVELMDGQEVINVRNTMIPVLRLQELHNIDAKAKKLDEGIVVVTERGGSTVGFLIDEIIGQQQLVVKALPQYSENIKGVSGCAVLGNGDICLILDLANLAKIATSKTKTKENLNG